MEDKINAEILRGSVVMAKGELSVCSLWRHKLVWKNIYIYIYIYIDRYR